MWVRKKHADSLSGVVDRRLAEKKNPPHRCAKARTREYTDSRGRRAWQAVCSCGRDV